MITMVQTRKVGLSSPNYTCAKAAHRINHWFKLEDSIVDTYGITCLQCVDEGYEFAEEILVWEED